VRVNIDGDIIRYSVGFATEGEPIQFACYNVDRMIDNILTKTDATEYSVLLTGEGNYREEIATLKPYKGQRTGGKPYNFDEVTEHLLHEHEAWICHGEEADDQMGIRAVQCNDVIATIDKDLDNVPGVHYNWRNDELYEVTEQEAMHHFYGQMLVGDRIDNIPGLFYLTKRKATAHIKSGLLECSTPAKCYRYIHDVFMGEDGDKDVVDAWLLELGRLLWIRHEEGQLWTPPEEDNE
jgi:hypothetical protein